MKSFSTILECLAHHATETPNKVVFTWVDIKCEEQYKMTFKQVEDQSNAVAARLLKLGCQKGDRVMIAYPFGLQFLPGMFGAMKIGVVPCSIYPPNPNQLKTDMPKFRRFAEDAGAKYALSTNRFAAGMTAASVIYKTGVTWIGTDKLPIKNSNPNKPKDYEQFVGEPEDICFIQYTSGSTGRPKGVMISHNNLAETCKGGVTLTDCQGPNDLEVLWVLQYHGKFQPLQLTCSPCFFRYLIPPQYPDMGLVTGFMGATYSGTPLVMASPLDFIVNPLLWTDMVEKYQATITPAPNFAYALLLKRLKQVNRTADWSCVKRAMFGGEPAQSHVVEAVSKTLAIKPEHIYNIYCMAEMVVLVTGGPAKPDSEGLVCCGEVNSPTLKLRIVEGGKEVEDGQVGSIWAQSPRVAAGYYDQAELTKATFANSLPGYEGSWLETGDLGKIVDGQMYITGRVKDVIIVNGKNYDPTDVELSIDEAFGDVIRPGRTSAFQLGEDSIGVTLEARKGFDKSSNEDLAVKIASEVVVLKLGVTPKTTSGKLKRSEIRQTTIACDWKTSSVILRFQPHDNAIPAENEVRAEATDFESSECPNRFKSHSTNSPKDFHNLVISILGSEVDMAKSWVEHGLTSLKSAELRNRAEEELHVVLPANFEQLHSTPEELSVFLEASEGKCFAIQDTDRHPFFHWSTARSRCSKLQMGFVQVLGILTILILVVAAIIPSYLIAAELADCDTSRGKTCTAASWLLLPLLLPICIISFSIILVLCKTLIIGKYHPQEINLMSWDYLRWWFIDRLLHIWELFAGRFLLETKCAWLFYWLLGADIAWSVKIDAFIRECDLVSIGANSSVGHAIRCRKFRPWTEDSLSMVFLPIDIGSDCKISGMVSPGATIGAGCKLERLAVVEERAQVSPEVIARGNPAYNAGTCRRQQSNWQEDSLLDAFKILWMFSEAYHYSALYFLANAILKDVLPPWRYHVVLHWFLLFPFASLLAMVTSIIMKWLLIGKRDPSTEYEGTLWRRATNWACDYHFRIAAWTLGNFMGGSKLASLIQWLHGLDVDAVSALFTATAIFPPSKVDYMKVRQSFLSLAHFELDRPAGEKIEILGSSLGRDTVVHAGAKVIRSNIPSRSQVSDKIYDLNPPYARCSPSLLQFFLPELAQLILLAFIFWSIIPSFELAASVSGGNHSSGVVTLVVGVAIAFQFLVWILIAKINEWAVLNVVPPKIQTHLFSVYTSYVEGFRDGNPVEVFLMGTPMFQMYVRVMGAEVNGDLWFFDCTLDEFANYHFQGNTVVDNAYPRGHYFDINGLTLDDVYISGVVHPGCYIAAGAIVDGKENGSWKSFFPSSDKKVAPGKKQPSRQSLREGGTRHMRSESLQEDGSSNHQSNFDEYSV
ncbi:D-alanine--D-alanyl carrier protein ligase [Seminavis robusta]|uniref:D-alanine--D-alanyl carrier protein ligase n=1 Tax=Seminavis robusta TaxID=568900 RepID=A0A9N8DX22_9STRA|nr:D-alanine--D-alanyl carrier protein ligase [Seminavis robusta]|eukprot:Sro433_g141750.1 D-alanine--D-alanyl carrier protein ligase (1384) ;mRNA; f:4086-8237